MLLIVDKGECGAEAMATVQRLPGKIWPRAPAQELLTEAVHTHTLDCEVAQDASATGNR